MLELAEKESFFVAIKNKSRDEIREIIFKLQDDMLEMKNNGNLEELDFSVNHFFAPNVYARQMTLPKGGLIIGKIHKHSHLNIISSGHCYVLTDNGALEIIAPHTFVSDVATKRVVLVLEETIWTTIHITNETDLEKIEKEIIAESYKDTNIFDMEKADI